MRRDLVRLVRRSAVLTMAVAFASCTDNNSPLQPNASLTYVTPTGLLTANPPQIFLGAGDISSCSNSGDEATALLLDAQPVGTVFNIGDDAYENGTTSEFNCYHATWGRHKARTMPSPGNHEYNTNGASGYYQYFGAAAHPSSNADSAGFYSFDLGAWHIISLNSNKSSAVGSKQRNWLVADLAAHPNMCTLAYFHHPLYSSTGGSGSGGITYTGVRQFYNDLYAAHADLVLGGHRHFYERIAPMKPDGTSDPVNGLRQLIVGSGGIGGGTTTNVFPLSEVRNGSTFGVIKLYLYDDSYAWKFLPVAGKTFTDSGSAACHSSGGGGGGISASNSTVGAAPTSFTAGSGSSTITATIRDGSNNPVSGANVVFSATGSGNTFTPTNATTNGSGVATSTFTSTGAGAKTVTATANGTTINQQPSVTVNPGPVSAAVSTVSANPGSFVAGSGSSTITITAKDASGNTISGMPVTVASTGSGNTLTPASGSTNSSGVFTSTLQSTVAELKTVSATINSVAITQTAAVNVTTSGGGGGAITQTLLNSGGNPVNQAVFTTASISPAPNALVTIAIRSRRNPVLTPTVTGGGLTGWTAITNVDYVDPSSNPHRLVVFRAMSGTPGSGPITITFSNSVSNVDWIVSQWTGVDQSGTNGSGAIGNTGSAAANGVTTLTVPLAAFGSASNVGYGLVGVGNNGPVSPGSGFAEIGEASSGENTVVEGEWGANQNTIQASWTSSNAGMLGIEIKAGGGGAPTVSPTLSSVAATSPITASGGSSTATITVTARDGSGNPLSGATVVLAATGTGNTLTQPVATTALDGTITGSLSSTKAENKTISATINAVAINQQPVVTVNPGVEANLVYTTQPSNTAANAPISPAVVLDVRDAFNNHVNSSASVTMDFGNNAGPGTLSGTLTQGAVNGVATFSDLAINTIASGYTLKASATGLTDALSNAFNITPPAPSASLSTVVAGTPSFTAGGNSDITVTVKDGLGNLMSGVTVTLSSNVGSDVVTQPSAVTNGSGQATGNVAATAAGTHSITAVAGGITLNQKPDLAVSAAAADAGQSTLTALPASITQTTGTSNITVTVRDQYGNPVNLSNVVLSATGTGNTLLGGGSTNASGVATGTLSSSVAEGKTVSATADGTPITQTATVTVTPPSSGITHTLLTAGNDPNNVAVYNTASIAPAANALVTIAVVGHRSTAAAAVPTVTGGGMSSWVQVGTVTFSTVGTPLKRMTIFRALSASPGSGPITITFPATESNASWIVSQWTGVNTSGTNGSGAIGQVVTPAALDATTSISATLAALSSPNNVAYGVVGTNGSAIGINPGGSFTEISEQKPAESPHGILEALFAANQTVPSASWTGAFSAAILAVEIKAGP